jgi:hypothetical protein
MENLFYIENFENLKKLIEKKEINRALLLSNYILMNFVIDNEHQLSLNLSGNLCLVN